MGIYNSYARGVIEVLYEKLIEGAASPDDLVRNVMNFTEEWSDKFLEEPEDLDLDKILNA